MYHELKAIGRLVADPEMRYTQSGTPVVSIRLAVTRRLKKGETWVDAPLWLRCSIFGKSAEFVGSRFKKGTLVFVTGELQPNEDGNPPIFTRKDGTTGASYEMRVQNYVPLNGLKEKTEAEPAAESEAQDEFAF